MQNQNVVVRFSEIINREYLVGLFESANSHFRENLNSPCSVFHLGKVFCNHLYTGLKVKVPCKVFNPSRPSIYTCYLFLNQDILNLYIYRIY